MKKIPPSDIGKFMTEESNRFLRAWVLKADAMIKEGTPVDNGRLAVSWQVGENDSSGKPAPPGKYSNTTPKIKTTNYSNGNEKVGKKYSIHNNLEYAEPVMYGSSLPPSWGGVYRSKRGLQPKHLELLAKDISKTGEDLWKDQMGDR